MIKLANSFDVLVKQLAKPMPSLLGKIPHRLSSSGNCGNEDSSAEAKIEPVSLSYNSYETASNEATAPPVIIMHGKNTLTISIIGFISTAILCSTGLFGSKQNWRSIGKAIHAKSNPLRKVITVDARNHGESPHSSSHRYEDLAEDIREFYRQQKIEKAIVLGHSMGKREFAPKSNSKRYSNAFIVIS